MSALPPNLMQGFALTKDQRASQLWVSIAGHLKTELDRLRARNDSATLSEAETARLRGHIQCIKALLALDTDPPPLQARPVSTVTAARQVLG